MLNQNKIKHVICDKATEECVKNGYLMRIKWLPIADKMAFKCMDKMR